MVVMSRILVVEDDADAAQVVSAYLTREGYAVEVAHDGAAGLQAALKAPPALVVLDWMLPGESGVELLTRLRAGPHALKPVLMLTARAQDAARVEGLERGADDYLTKPFSVAELLARIHVRLREQGGQSQLTLGELVLDVANGRASVAGEFLNLPEREFLLLKLLVQYRGRVFTKEDLERALYGADLPDSNTIEVYVYNLRRKLKAAGMDGVIRTVRNRGYLVV